MWFRSALYNFEYKLICVIILTSVVSSDVAALSPVSSEDCEKPVLHSDQSLLEVQDFRYLGWSISINYYKEVTWVSASSKENLVDDDQFLRSLNSRLQLIKLSLPKVKIDNVGPCKKFLAKAIKIL